MGDFLVVGLTYIGVGLAAVGVISFVLSWFVALKSSPSKRAFWTAGIAYVIATFILLSDDFGGNEWAIPLIVLPGGLVAFFYWRLAFRRAWTSDPDVLAEGISLEDDDWRVGLLRFLALATVVLAAAFVRWSIKGH